MNTKRKLFDASANDDLSERRILGGQTTNINNFNEIKYRWTAPLYRRMVSNYWIPEIISLDSDRVQYRNALSHEEREGFNETLSFLIFLDSIQATALPSLGDYITAPEASRIMVLQAFQEVVHCYAEGTEILTSQGWKDFRDISYDDKIANYWEDKSITFENPSEIIESTYKGKMVHIHNGRYNSLVTPNHRVVYDDYYTNSIRVKRADKIGLNNHKIPVSGIKKGGLQNLSVRDKLKIAFQSDGTIINNGNFTKDGVCYRFHLKKSRKINRLIELCSSNDIRYTITDSSAEGFSDIYIWYPELFDKNFNEYDLSNLSTNWCREFIHEISYYDGTPLEHGKHLRYMNTNVEAVEKVFAIGTLGNYRVSRYINDGTNGFGKNAENPKPCHYLNFVDQNYVTGRELKKDFVNYDGNIYCVTVPSGMILVRYNDKVTVSGNSQAYSYILESICDPQEIHGIYYRFKNNEELLKRCSQMTDLYSLFRNDPNDENLAMMFLASLLLEGILFFNGFYFFYSLAYNERMTKCADEIRLINRKHFTAVVKFPLIAGNSF
jgi:ribonucleotide reductase beta subunit family protein with ferritin-like domain